MSDLAPFVAATLRDKVIVDLQDENQKLREIMADWESGVRCTGVHGVPVYAHGHLNSTKPYYNVIVEENPNDNTRRRIIRLESVVADAKQQPSTLQELKNTEIHIGHSKQNVSLDEFEMSVPDAHRQDQHGGTYYVVSFRNWQHPFNYVQVKIEIGPYNNEQIMTLTNQVQYSIDELFQGNGQFGQNPFNVQGLVQVKFMEIILHEYMENQD